MAKSMQIQESLKKLPEGTSINCLAYNSLPITIVKSERNIKHIGYSLFSLEQRKSIGVIRCNFIERFLLSADLPIEREKTIEMEMKEEGISFEKGNLASLKSIINDSTLRVEAEIIKEKQHRVKWSKGNQTVCMMAFPANHELLLGRKMLENDLRLQADILATADTIIPKKYHFKEEQLTRHNDVYILKGKSYVLKDFTDDRYFLKQPDGSFISLFSISAPGESLANILQGNDILHGYILKITQKQYNYKESTFTVPLCKFVAYYQGLGFKPYFGIIRRTFDTIECLLILQNIELGCNHILRIDFNVTTMMNKAGDIQARLNAFVPTSNINNLYYEHELNNQQ